MRWRDRGAALLLAAALPILPASSTPGVIRTDKPASAVCDPAHPWGHDRRHVTRTMKAAVAASYGVSASHWHDVEFDHRIPRSLLGADDVRNLWPERRHGPWSADWKDQLEATLHRLVCAKRVSLGEAQAVFQGDWRLGYQRYVRDIPLPSTP